MENLIKNISKYIGIKFKEQELKYIIDSQNLDYNLEEFTINSEVDLLKIMNAISVHLLNEEWQNRSFLPPEIYLRQGSKLRKEAKKQGFELSW